MVDSTIFHRGMLYGIAFYLRTFKADGDRFHLAYRAALHADPSPTRDTREALECFDPMFGTYRWAEDMILIGIRDLLVELDGSTFTRATIRISRAMARKMGKRDIGDDMPRFRVMGKAFVDEIGRKEADR